MPNKRGIELLPKIKPTRGEKALTLWTQKVGVPFIVGIQLIFLLLLGLQLPLRYGLTTLLASVKEKEILLEYASETETLYRATQTKLAKIAEVKTTLCYSCAVKKVEAITPSAISLTSLTAEEEKITLTAETFQGLLFATYLSNIIKEEAIQAAAITSGSLSPEGLFSFTIELYFDKKELVRSSKEQAHFDKKRLAQSEQAYSDKKELVHLGERAQFDKEKVQ